MSYEFTRGPLVATPATGARVESLETRRLLASAYPLTDVPGPLTGDAPRASVNGEAFEAAAGRLYRSDGSTAATAQIAAGVGALFNWNGTLYFGASPEGTASTFTLAPGSTVPVELRSATGARLSPRAGSFVPVGDKLYFAATAGGVTPSVYVTDGTSQGTTLVHSGTPVGRAGNALVFSETPPGPGTVTSLWRTDGTPGGTVKIRDNLGASPTQVGHDVGGAVLFSGPGGLWRSDGTAEGTALLKTPFGPVVEWRRVGDAAYFIVAGSGNSGTLWKTDGTAAGTLSVGSAYNGQRLAQRVGPSMTSIGETVYYVAQEPARTPQLYATEGPGTSRRITNLGEAASGGGVMPVLAAAGDKVLFAARVGTPDYELWETAGEVGDATKVAGFVPAGGNSLDYGPLNLFAVGGSVFYTQRVYNGPTRLWRYGVSPIELDEAGVLVVSGTDPLEGVAGHDSIAVWADGVTVNADVNGITRSFPLAAVKRITVNGLGGNDGLIANGVTSIPLTFNGGGGHDTISVVGTPGDDVVTVTSSPGAGPGGSVHTSQVEGLSLDTLGGADRVTLVNLRVPANLTTGDGIDTLVIDDSGRGDAEDYTLTDNTVGRRAGTGPIPTLLGYEAAEGVNLLSGSGPNWITVTPSSTAAFTVNGGHPAAPAAPGDRLAVNVQGVTGAGHTPGAADSGQWTFADRRPVNYAAIEQTDDGTPLTADIVDVSPDPRKNAVASVRIVFSEPVTGFDPADLRLTRDGNPANLLTAAQTLTTADGGLNWLLENLAPLTAADGVYTLSLPATGSGVVDAVGSPLAGDVFDSFIVDNVAPTVDITDVDPDPRTEPVADVHLVLSEPVTGLDVGDLLLTRDGGSNLLTAAQSLSRLNDRTYLLVNLAPLTRAAGEYNLRLSAGAAAAVTDLAGNPLASGATDSWRTWAAVTGRNLFYNGSTRDGGNTAVDPRDDDAVAPDKRVLLPGQAATFANYTSYDRGVNGVMIDVTGLPGGLTAADFAFRAGNSADPSTWAPAPRPSAVVVRRGAGVNGSDRVTLTWADYSLRNRWLQVRMLSNAATGLPEPGDVFYVGNLAGETGNFPRGVGAAMDMGDFNATRNQVFMTDLPLTQRWDHNRDGRVNAADLAIVRRNLRAAPLAMFTAPPAQPVTAALSRRTTRTERPGGRGVYHVATAPAPAAALTTVPNEGSGVGSFFEAGGVVFFLADDGIHGRELWKTDGTPAGTVMVADINPGRGSSDAQQFRNLGGVLVFSADDGTHGLEPWRSDGTAAGTYLLEDVNPGRDTSYPWAPSTYDGSNRAIVIGGVMYFAANRAEEGFELWRTDGTPFGTYPVREIAPGAEGSFPEGMVELNGNLVFTARNALGASRAIWQSSGTAFGTTPVGGETVGQPAFLTASGGHVYFQHSSSGAWNGVLWKTNGTASGTSAVTDLRGEISWPVDANGTLFMVVRQFDGVGGYRLYKSDGTADGTIGVGDTSGPNLPFNPRALTSANGLVFFIANHAEAGWQLWRSDGTTAGTRVVKVINPDTNGSWPDSLTAIDGLLYFTALEMNVGRQIWRTDGTEAGTVRLTNVVGGVGEQATFAKQGNSLYFGAEGGDVGWELWRTDGTPEGTSLVRDINQTPRIP